MFDVIVANGRYFGGGMKMAPSAEPDDGLFDVVTIGDVTKRDLVRRCRRSTAARICRTRRPKRSAGAS